VIDDLLGWAGDQVLDPVAETPYGEGRHRA